MKTQLASRRSASHSKAGRTARRTRNGVSLEAMERRRLMASLGVMASMDYPRFGLDFGNATLTSGGDLHIETSALNKQSSDGGPITPLIPTAELDVNIIVDASGELVSGVPLADDLVLSDPTGVLLTGEITAFNEESGATEYLFIPTGGTAEYFGPTGYFKPTSQIGLYLTLDTVPIPFGTNYTSPDAKGEFGVIPPFGNPPSASLGDRVWLDCNENGRQDAGEDGVPGVTVELLGAGGVPTGATTVTDANGLYLFPNLVPGDYSVKFVLPTGYTFTTYHAAGSTEVNDSDANTVTGVSDVETLSADENYRDLDAGIICRSSISGYVYRDCDNDGKKDPEDGGIAGVTIKLYTGGGTFITSVTTNANGFYEFGNLKPGTYRVVEVQPAGWTDGKETLGKIDGKPGGSSIPYCTNDQFLICLPCCADATDFNFGEFKPAKISGFVWLDYNNDGTIDFDEDGIGGVCIYLYKLVGDCWIKVASDSTDCYGYYCFSNLTPGDYKIVEDQPCYYVDGKESLGTVDGLPSGTVGNDVFCNVELNCGSKGVNYNFGEKPPADCPVRCGQAGTIAFWYGRYGQQLLRCLNGGATATNLGKWMASMFPNLYGANGTNFEGKTNDYIARYYQTNLFSNTSQKLETQIMAVAFACYVTSRDFAGTTASAYGFIVTDYGLGVATFNVGANGAAFGVANNSTKRVIDLLVAADGRSPEGPAFDADGNNVFSSTELAWRSMAYNVFSAINNRGGVG